MSKVIEPPKPGPAASVRQPAQLDDKQRRHVISALVKNVPGLLAQVANLFAARGYNIESLTVGETETHNFSRMTVTVRGEEKVIEALKQGMRKFVNVIKVLDFTGVDHVERDLALIKINIPSGARTEILQLVEIFEGKVVDIGLKDLTVELVGPEQKLDTFLMLMKTFGVKEFARTGRIAMARGSAMEGHEVEA